eukprot:5215018-Prymnesium_polylepis.1
MVRRPRPRRPVISKPNPGRGGASAATPQPSGTRKGRAGGAAATLAAVMMTKGVFAALAVLLRPTQQL